MNLIKQELMGIYESILDCLKRKQYHSALILMYAAIDIVASVEAPLDEPVNQYFKRWVDSYLLPTNLINCTSVELYGARCGIVHTMTPDSNLSRGGKARNVYYALGPSKAADLDETLLRMEKQGLIVAVEVDQLVEAFRIGMLAWEADVSGDPNRLEQVKIKSQSWFTVIQPTQIRDFLSIPPAATQS